MGFMELKRLMSMQQKRERRRRQIQARYGLVASPGKRKGSRCNQDISSQSGKTKGYSGPELPEDIWRHIHSLMELRDAARAACVSRAFLRSWRCHPNLTFSRRTFGLHGNVIGNDEAAKDFTHKVDRILKKHSRVGLKTFKLWDAPKYAAKDCYYLDSWLQMAVTPGIEELVLTVCSKYYGYKFPCSLLSDGNGDSIRHLHLGCCAFRPAFGLGCLRSLTSLNLCVVRITGDELGCLLSNSFALERLRIMYCDGIICLKVPCLLQRLVYLEVFSCTKLKVIECKAPNLSTYRFTGLLQVQLSLGEAPSQIKNLYMDCPGTVCYTRTELASSMINLKYIVIKSSNEIVDTPVVSSKYLHLKYLSICLNVTFTPSYDYFSLVSFIDASPSLETLILDVWQQRRVEHVSVFQNLFGLRQMPPEQTHGKLRILKVCGFSSAKSLVELICHILGRATSLEWLILDTIPGHDRPRCSGVDKVDKCLRMQRDNIVEAFRALLAVEIYIRPKVPSMVNLNVLAPCSRCHVVEDLRDHVVNALE